MLWCLVSISLVVVASTAEPKWIEIVQKDTEAKGAREMALDRSAMLSNIFSKNDLKYEDLVDVIGPGFERDFHKFLEVNKDEFVDNSTQLLAYDGTPFGSGSDEEIDQGRGNASETPDFKPNIDLENDDITANSTKVGTQLEYEKEKVKAVSKEKIVENERKLGLSKPDKDGEPVKSVNGKVFEVSEMENVDNTTHRKQSQRDRDKTGKKKNLVLKMVKIEEPPPPTFTEVLNFLKEIQESLLVDATGGIKSKIKSLENFKNELISNIGKTINSQYCFHLI